MRTPDRALGCLFYFFAALFGAGLLIVAQSAAGLQPPHDSVTTADFLGIILSALGVMVAILTLFLGVLAIFGWTAFRTIIEDKFEDLFRRRFDANNPAYGALVDQLVEDARARNAAEAIANQPSANDPDLNADLDSDGSADEIP